MTFGIDFILYTQQGAVLPLTARQWGQDESGSWTGGEMETLPIDIPVDKS